MINSKIAFLVSFLAFSGSAPAQDIGELPDNVYMKLEDSPEILAKAIIENNLAYQGFRDSFRIFPRVDKVYVTKVSKTAVRYKLIGENYDAATLLGCVEWTLTADKADESSPTRYASRVKKTDCSEYSAWEKFMEVKKLPTLLVKP